MGFISGLIEAETERFSILSLRGCIRHLEIVFYYFEKLMILNSSYLVKLLNHCTKKQQK